MAEITITIQDNGVERVLVLREPGFDELAAAFNVFTAGYSKTGVPDVAKAGKIIIDTCAIEGKSDKMFFAANSGKLLFSAALKASELVEYFEAELKKN
jgi:hypothetical protein